MTLATRVIPLLLKRGNSLVKGKKFDAWRVVGSPLQSARIHAARGVDELMILDIGAESPDLEMVKSLTDSMFSPVTVGGGVKSVEDVRDLLNAGADKVCLQPDMAMVHEQEFVSRVADKFGCQAIVISWEYPRHDANPLWIAWRAKQMEKLGAGEILLQSVDRDGMMEGYDLELIRKVSQAVNIPVIASCGAGTYEHLAEAVRAGASAVAAGSLFLFTDATPKGASEYLAAQGIEARVA